jgi:hypothetical protein
MALTFQVVIDCADPHSLAAWWAETLDWKVEAQDADFIRSMVAQGFATEAETTAYNGALVWATGAAISAGDAGLEGSPRVLFQLVPEPKQTKNRVHLDLRGSSDREQLVQRLLDRGATQLHTGQQGPHTWVTMTDPEGNEFCA